MKQSDADPNLRAAAVTGEWSFTPAPSHPAVSVLGFPWFASEGHWDRLPRRLMDDASVRAGLRHVAAQPSGGRLRFRTDAESWALRATLARTETGVFNTPASLSGFDVYAHAQSGWQFVKCVAPASGGGVVEGEIKRPRDGDGLVDWTVYLPLQNPVASLELAFPDGATVAPASPEERPVIFYGSSITQGFSASRPGLTYPAMIARRHGLPFTNLGYGGNAKGDPEVAEEIARLPMRAFVCDLDHNIYDFDELVARHAPFVATIRRAHPTLPILCVSAPNFWNDPDWFGRRADVIRRTVDEARAAGDRHIEFLAGREFWPADTAGDCTVDRTHPNDAGFLRMAEVIGARVSAMLR